MCKVGFRFLVPLRQRHPDLYTVKFLLPISQVAIGAFRVNNAAPCRHPVNRAGFDGSHRAETIPVNDRSREQIRNRGKAHMRVWAHINTLPRREVSRFHLVEKDKRPYAASV
jgi:hypothetical protein